MDKEHLIKYKDSQEKVTINFKNGRFYSGVIKDVGDTSIVFLDKYNNSMIIDLDMIAYVTPKSNGEQR
jgi:sRNA-binding regulator protein Hfq